MSVRIIFASLVTLVAGLVYFTPLDMRDGRDLEAHGAIRPVSTYRPTGYRPVERHTGPAPTTTEPAPPATTLPPPPAGARCPQWWDLAQLAGWTYADLEDALDLIMWRESRCRPDVRSRTSDSGLLQINDIHLPHLETLGILPEMLFDPWWNLIAALEVAELAESYGWHRFQPWAATYP